MPGPKSHEIAYKQAKEKLTPETLNAYPNYDSGKFFAQGHDYYLYHNWFFQWNKQKRNKNTAESTLLQENNFVDFVYTYLKTAQQTGTIEDEATRLFMNAGYVPHHILDLNLHPYLDYTTGQHTPDENEKTWTHGNAERDLEVFMALIFEGKDLSTYKVYKDFKVDKKMITSDLITTLDKSLEKTYEISQGGQKFKVAFTQFPQLVRTFKYDPIGLKNYAYNILENQFGVQGATSFSYHVPAENARQYFNMEHEEWVHPIDETIRSNETVWDLYYTGVDKSADATNKLERLCQKGVFNRDDISEIIPDRASTHGLECGYGPWKIKNKKLKR